MNIDINETFENVADSLCYEESMGHHEAPYYLKIVSYEIGEVVEMTPKIFRVTFSVIESKGNWDELKEIEYRQTHYFVITEDNELMCDGRYYGYFEKNELLNLAQFFAYH